MGAFIDGLRQRAGRCPRTSHFAPDYATRKPIIECCRDTAAGAGAAGAAGAAAAHTSERETKKQAVHCVGIL